MIAVMRQPWLVALLVAAGLAGGSPAVAATESGGGTATTEAPATADQDGDDDALVAIGVLVFGAIALGMTLLYLDAWRRSSQALIEGTLSAIGQLPEYEVVAAAVPEVGARGAEETPVQLSIRGPALLHVGRGAQFRSFRDGEPVDATWEVRPAAAGSGEPATGNTTTVTPTRPGPLTVRASAAGATADAQAVATTPPQNAGAIPLVGVGYGGITIAIFALTLAGAATAYGALDGAALVALAGAVVGYFFVEARGRQEQASGTPSSGASDGGAGDAP